MLIIFIIEILLLVFMVVGGVYLTQFAFQSTQQNCKNPSNISKYCYDLSTTELGFAKLTAVLSFPMTIALTLSMAYVIIKSI
jgi:flagellar basal body-associated protein FliL